MTGGQGASFRADGFLLRPMRLDDAHALALWSDDGEAHRFVVRGVRPQRPEDVAEAYDAARRSGDIEFAIVTGEDAGAAACGVVGLHGVQWIPRHAEFRIFIGDPAARGRGIGKAACRIVCAYAFESLNLQKVSLGVAAENRAAIGSYERTGFTREGVLRREIWRHGRHHDAVRMSLLVEDYRAVAPNWAEWPMIERQLCAPR